jgi:putative ABC transport system permease protein
MGTARIAVRLAWRNVWRNIRRTVLTLLTILVGSAMIILMNAFAKGGHDQMIEDAVASNTGHIQLHEKGYWENRTIDYALQPDGALLETLRKNARVRGASVRIHADGLLSFGNTTAGAMIQGVDPEAEKTVSTLHACVLPGGRYLAPDDRKSIVMGETLAKNLGARTGSAIALISQGFDGSIAAEKLTVIGIFRSGNPEYDQALVLMPLAQADETFTMMGYVHSVTLRLVSPSDTAAVKSLIAEKTDPGAVEILGWDELLPELVQFIVMDDVSNYIFDFILFMVVAFGILNTIQMSVFERTREFGIMLSIGTTPGQVVSMVLVESFFIAMLGITLGLAAGWGLSYYFQVNPIDYSDYAKEIAVWGVTTVTYPTDATALNLSMTALITLALALLFSIFPARRASRLEPVQAIRHL